jgi:hypothetical protein
MTDTATARLERLLAMTVRLVTALTMDIAALEQRRPRELKLVEPELQRVAAVYQREAASFTQAEIEAAPAELRERYLAQVRLLRDLLKRHQRLLTRIRRISEGMIRAVADELARRQASARPYARTPVAKPRSPGAMVFNQTA